MSDLIKKEQSKIKNLEYEDSDKKRVKIIKKNVGLIETCIRLDSKYKKAFDKNAVDSTAHWGEELRKIFNGGDSSNFSEYLLNIITSIDRENSTHLNSDKKDNDKNDTRMEMKDRILRICKNNPKELKRLLINEDKKYTLIQEIAKKDERIRRRNISFATKFCHYMCFYCFDDINQDNYSIYDGVLEKALPLYINESIPSLKKCDEDKIGETYKKYIEIIDNRRKNISRNGFDHLIWYFHKGEYEKNDD